MAGRYRKIYLCTYNIDQPYQGTASDARFVFYKFDRSDIERTIF